MTNKLSASLALAATLFCSHVLAQNVEIKDAWARATVQSQKATGAFMTLTAKTDTTLVGGGRRAPGSEQRSCQTKSVRPITMSGGRTTPAT